MIFGASVSRIRTATTAPEANVSAATNHTAVVTPKASATRPAGSVPTAYPTGDTCGVKAT